VAVISVSPTRALRRPLRLDARALVGVLLMLVAVGGSIAVWTTQQDTRSVLVAARELPAGTTVTAADLAIAHVRLDDSLYAAALPASQVNSVVGRQLAEPAHANQLLVAAQLSTHPTLGPDQLVLAIPVRAETAAGGRIRPGDAVQVLATDSKHDGSTKIVLPRAIVYDTARAQQPTNSLTGAGADVGSPSPTSGAASWISVVVTQDQAVQLAKARWGQDLDVALLAPQAAAG
jgi:Flp pilus assembly protein CpaB